MRGAQLLRVVLVAVMIPIAACTDAFGIGRRPVGTWSIEEYNGQQMPAVFQSDSFETTEIVSDVYLVKANGSYTNTYTFRVTSSSGIVRLESYSDSGYWDLASGEYYLEDARTGNIAYASVSGGTMVVRLDSDTYRYRRLED